MKTTETHVYFWNGIYSNWDNCHFTDPKSCLKFENSEQAFMWYKADTFKDDRIRKLIEVTSNPKIVKGLGRQIENYDESIWDRDRFDKMVYVNELKFSQNPFYGKALLNTENRIIVEASPYDKIWGVGLLEDDPLILDEKNWKGLNLLGKALREVRSKMNEIYA